jgi:predicted nucleic acid-binding protein
LHHGAAEAEWVLRSVYGFPPARLVGALSAFVGLARVKLEQTALVAKALDWMSRGMDFADALHLASAEHCEAFASFDQSFAKVARLSSVSVRVL